MRIAVFGTGGVGGFFGGRLAQAGEEVIFIARGEHLEALRLHGLQVDSIQGDFHVQPVQATSDTRRVGEVDMVLVAVKSWQVPEAALAMQPMLGEDAGVVFLGNGVDAPAQLASALGARHILGGLCKISAYIAGPGYIRHVSIEPLVAFGELDGRPSPRVKELQQAFVHAKVNVSVPDDIQAAMWEKFIFIAAFSGVGAVTRAPVGAIRSLPETRQMLTDALQEIADLARQRKIKLAGDIVSQILANVDGFPPATLASMQRDVIEGRPSELGSQSGAVVRMGLESGVPTPTHAFIYHSLLPQELKARQEIQF